MELLKKHILSEGIAITGGIIRVDSFLNHQVDPMLIDAMAEEFCCRFTGIKCDRILTVEASGIAPAVMTGLKLKVPVVFAKKSRPSTGTGAAYSAKVHSFTKQKDYEITVSADYIRQGESIIIIDDFLAHGSASAGLIDIVHQAGAEVTAIGIVIEKGFQDGGRLLREKGFRVESLAIITGIDGNTIQFR
ncbi:MAG TPA: xanthine phosphoribosyltransferase [Spirochaetota bacterium]|nr:xanthine phosphoribosyltransferase [Spirochaetota bacterium]